MLDQKALQDFNALQDFLSEQIVQFDKQYDVNNIFLKFIRCDKINRIFTPRVLFSFHMT